MEVRSGATGCPGERSSGTARETSAPGPAAFRCGPHRAALSCQTVKVNHRRIAAEPDVWLAGHVTRLLTSAPGDPAYLHVPSRPESSKIRVGPTSGCSPVLSAKRLGAGQIILMGRHQAGTDLGRERGATTPRVGPSTSLTASDWWRAAAAPSERSARATWSTSSPARSTTPDNSQAGGSGKARTVESRRCMQTQNWDLSTSTSQPGKKGSKPCSISHRIADRLRHDHHARTTSRSTSAP